MEPRIYTYKVTFEETSEWYWGVHKEKKYGETYLGSPVAHRWKWDWYTPHIQILEFFEYTEQGWVDAKEVEHRLITPDLNNPLCLNEANGGYFSLEALKQGGKIGGRRVANLGYLDPSSPNTIKTFESLSEAGKIGGAKTRDSGKLKETSRLGGLAQGPRNKGMSWYHRFDSEGQIIRKRSKFPLSEPWVTGKGKSK